MFTFIEMIMNIDIYANCIYMLLNECTVSLKRIKIWDGGYTLSFMTLQLYHTFTASSSHCPIGAF
jgi:hypothetical protein